MIRPIAYVLALAAFVALPWIGDQLRPRHPRCALDGADVMPEFRACVVVTGGRQREFCGVRCAQAWLGRHAGTARAVRVTDLVSGRLIDAGDAWFVRTSKRSPLAPDQIRVFAKATDAANYARAHRGRILQSDERPFTHDPRTDRHG